LDQLKRFILMDYTTAALIEKLWAHIDGAYAPNTIRAYKADMDEFINYCNKHAHCALPANPLDISKFLLAVMSQGVKSSTIRRKVASISAVHRLSNLADPTKHPEIKLCIRKINRQLGNRFDQAFPVNRSVLDQLLKVCGDDIRGARDRALLLLAYDSMRRRAELVSLSVEDIEVGNQGQCSILLRRSKTDQVGSGHWLHLSQETSSAITAWLDSAQIKNGHLLRGIRIDGKVCPELGASQVSRIFKGLAQKAKLDHDIVSAISGHSMRVGAAQDLLINGASLPQIMVKGGWVKTDTVMRYIDKVQPSATHTNLF
jgi:site-specific recombinase XerD